MHDLALTAIGKDRPGIVAGVTKVLYEHGCNLSDCSMTILSGQFAMIMLIEAPDGVTMKVLEQALKVPAEALGLTISLREVAATPSPAPGHPYVISVYGADKPGIVYRVTEALAGRGANVTDLMSRMAGSNVYTVVLDVDLPGDVPAGELGGQLARLAEELQVELVMRPADADEL